MLPIDANYASLIMIEVYCSRYKNPKRQSLSKKKEIQNDSINNFKSGYRKKKIGWRLTVSTINSHGVCLKQVDKTSLVKEIND